ncbi:MAG TPA: phenylalanine--tRNA ligase beta subunit-related protein [Roseiflexaceae bacterium]|nr:phenylalanine--tRNA ligase beta subunit-related protein [Roseiflexaceae bacterium]
MQVIVTDAFWRLFPEARIGIIIARGIDNTAAAEEAAALLGAAGAAAARDLAGVDIASHPAVAPWRQAYARFGAKPSKFRSSIESLLRSAQAGRLRTINPLVDLYNAVSLRHQLPCGGEDLAAIAGDVHLTRAAGGESFRTIGAAQDDPPPAGEVIYADDAGAICRCFNWRESDRTRLTSATTDALLVIEALPAHAPAQLDAALRELAHLVATHLGGALRTAVLHRAQPALAVDGAHGEA